MKLDTLLEQLGCRGANFADRQLEALQKDASNRSYYRLRLPVPGRWPTSIVVMHISGDPLRSEEISKHGQANELGEIPFLDVARYLEAGALPVPKVYAEDRAEGLIALEDLGDRTLETELLAGPETDRAGAWPRWYGRALELLVAFQRYGAASPSGCVAFSRAYDHDLLRWELDHFVEWGLRARGIVPSPSQSQVLGASFEAIASELAAAPQVLVHRDYQSRNLMVQGEQLRLIDFQDALMGPRAFDLVCLLCDSYIDLSQPMQEALLGRYVGLASLEPAQSEALVSRQFWLQTVQRKLKDAGRFVFIDRKKGNPSFLPYVEPSLVYVRRALAMLEDQSGLAHVLDELVPAPSKSLSQ